METSGATTAVVSRDDWVVEESFAWSLKYIAASSTRSLEARRKAFFHTATGSLRSVSLSGSIDGGEASL